MKNCRKVFSRCSLAGVILASGLLAGCETTDKKQSRKIELPEFIKNAKVMASKTAVADEKPLIVTDIAPERAVGKNEFVMPKRKPTPPKKVAFPDYPKSLFKKGTRPDEPIKGPAVTLDFDATPLAEAIPVFAEVLGFAYNVDPAVKGTVTLSLTDAMTPRELWGTFEQILAFNGAYVSREKKLVKILPMAKMPQEHNIRLEGKQDERANVHVELITVQEAKASEILANVKPFLTPGASLTEVKRLNALLLVETPNNVKKIQELIGKLDRQWQKDWPQVSIRCHSVDTEKIIEELKNILPIIGLPAKFGDTAQDGVEIKITDIPRLQVIIVSAPMEALLTQIEKWVSVLDREDIGEQEHIFFYNVRHSTIEELRAALDTFFVTEGSSAPTKRSSTSSKAGASSRSKSSSSTKRRTTSTTKSKTGDSDSRSSVFDEPVKVFEDGVHNRLVIQTTQRAYAIIEALLQRLDTPMPQVLIKATIVDITLTKQLQYGFHYAMNRAKGNWDATAGIGTNGDPGTVVPTIGFDPAAGVSSTGVGNGFSVMFSDANQAIEFVAAVAGDDNSSVISAPSVIAKGDEQSIIDVSESKSIPTSTSGVNNTNPVTNYDYKDAGIVLTVTPHITANNEVSLELKQEVDQFLDDGRELKNSSGDVTGFVPPTIQKRSIETKMIVPDGGTVLMGGLFKVTDTEEKDGIPVLMDIPYLGELFKHTYKKKVRNELLVLVTVNVLDEKTKLEKLLEGYEKSVEAMRGAFSEIGGVADEIRKEKQPSAEEVSEQIEDVLENGAWVD